MKAVQLEISMASVAGRPFRLFCRASSFRRLEYTTVREGYYEGRGGDSFCKSRFLPV